MRALDNLPVQTDFDKLPLHISESEIASLRTQWQIESLGMMLNYKMNWTEWYSIREFVQNALDATESVTMLFDDSYNISYIADDGSGIILRHLFLGEQKGETEREVHCLRGRFGEGMKLALLPLMRTGSRVIIRTVGTDYHFAAIERKDPKGSFHQINMFSQPNSVTQGTAIAIEEMDCLFYRTYFAPMIAKDDPEAVIITVKGGPEEFDDCKVRQVFDLPGKIFVRDIYVATTPALFGYNFWFDDTRSVLSSDRTEVRDSVYNYRKEFHYLMKTACKPFLSRLFETLFSIEEFSMPVSGTSSTNKFSKRQSLEWSVMDGWRNTDDLTADDAMTIFEIILNLAAREFSWSRGPKEQKTLEHHGVADLRDKLPDLRDLLAKFNLIKTPEELARAAELANETVIIEVSDFEVSTLDSAKELAEAMAILHRELNCLRQYLKFTIFDNVKIKFYAGNFRGSEKKVLGYFERSSRTVYIHTKNLDEMTKVLRTFIHEMAHAYCDDCIDISQEFEDAMQDISAHLMEVMVKGDCEVENIQQACKTISWNRIEFNQIIDEKVAAVANPFNLIRPEQMGTKDRDLLDQTFFRISKGGYADLVDVVPILWGYSPNSGYYNIEWNCRGLQLKDSQRMTKEQIIQKDKETIRKLKIDLPILVDQFTTEQWVELLKEHTRDELKPELRISGEDWSNPDRCLEFILKHPSRWIKSRNFLAYMELINPFPDMRQEYATGDPDTARQHYSAGTYADVTGLQKLREAAPEILKLVSPLQQFANYDPHCYPLKEKLIDWAANFGWSDILILALRTYESINRKHAIWGLAKLGNLEPVIRLLSTENHPEVVHEALEALRKRDRTLFDQIIDQGLENFRQIATSSSPDDPLNYHKQELRVFLDRALSARKFFEEHGFWPGSFRR